MIDEWNLSKEKRRLRREDNPYICDFKDLLVRLFICLTCQFLQLNKTLKFSEKQYLNVHIKYLYKYLDAEMFKKNEIGKKMQKSL